MVHIEVYSVHIVACNYIVSTSDPYCLQYYETFFFCFVCQLLDHLLHTKLPIKRTKTTHTNLITYFLNNH